MAQVQEDPLDLLAAPVEEAGIREARGHGREAGISGDWTQLGMLMDWRATGSGGQRTLCLLTDQSAATLFTLAKRADGYRLLSARELGMNASCSPPGAAWHG